MFGKIYDTNGCAGLFDSSTGAVQAGTANTEVNLLVAFATDGKTATVSVDGEALTLSRVAAQ